VARLPHGYTNHTQHGPDGVIEKVYIGPGGEERAVCELVCLSHLADLLPVPEVIGFDRDTPSVQLTRLPGRHGQDLLVEGHAHRVLTLVGATLRHIQQLPVSTFSELPGDGDVLVHGDFGPQNMLFDIDRGEVTGLLDWEFAHLGDHIEDLAWAEWIVRMHHPAAVVDLDALFTGAALHPAWDDRRASMLRACDHHLARCSSAADTDGIARWTTRCSLTAAWAE
jgi:aminoglycoside phosphotransferase